MKLISENKIDALGRVTLPAQIRHKLGMDKGDSVDIFEDNGKIIIKKHNISDTLLQHQTYKNLFYQVVLFPLMKIYLQIRPFFY